MRVVRVLSVFLFVISASVFIQFPSLNGQSLQPRQTLHGHVRPAVASGQARRLGDLPASQRLNVSIQLATRNQAQLLDLLGRLYDPTSPDYHHFLSVAEFTEQFAPSVEDYQATVAFARAHGLTVTQSFANRLVVPVSGTVAQIEETFNVKLGMYEHPTEARTFYSPDREPSLDLAVPVAHIAGLNNYSIPKPQVTLSSGGTTPATGSGPGGTFLGSDMRTAYYGNGALSGTGQSVGLVEFDGYNLSDVNLTFSNAGQTYSVPINNVLLDGATGAACQLIPSNCSDVEQVLDIVQPIGMAPGLSQVRVYIGESDVDVLNSIASEDIAQEVSISWSWRPDDPTTDDVFFQEMAAQGQSVLAASGDYAAYDPDADYNFYFPAEDPFVTVVGGTDLTTTGGAWSGETAWADSGGGISPDSLALPSWQTGLANSNNGGSNSFRNSPDVAMEANTDNYYCNLGTCGGGAGGTSFAAPRWAAFLALANQQAATSGGSPVGFINPAIYAIGQGTTYNTDFRDIISGNNFNGNFVYAPYTTYNAVTGYDLVTGWGSPTPSLIDDLAPVSAAGFTLSSSAKSLTINPGSSGSTYISVQHVGGFAGSVQLTVSGLPAGMSVSWSGNPAYAQAYLKLSVDPSAVRGTYLLTVTGVSGSYTASVNLNVQVNGPGFTLAASPSQLMAYPGQSSQTTFTITPYGGFTGAVNFAITSPLPTGVTATWAPDPSGSSSVLTLTVAASAPVVRTVLTITGTSGSLSATASFALSLFPPDFYVVTSTPILNLAPGGSASTTLTIVPIGTLSSPVTFTTEQTPPGVTVTFNPVTTSTTTTLTLTAASNAPPGTASFLGLGQITNCCGGYVGWNVTVGTSATFYLGLSPANLTLTQGGTAQTTVKVNRVNGFSGSVPLAINNLPAGVTASFNPTTTTNTSVLTLTATNNAAVGFATPSPWGSYGSYITGTTLYLFVNPSPSFTLSPATSSVSVGQGASVPNTITINPQTGFTGSVSLAVTSPLPSGVTASFGTNPATTSSVLHITAGASAVPGTYPVTVAGTANGQTVTTGFSVIVGEAIATSTLLAVNPTGAMNPGYTYTLTATVTPGTGTLIPTGSVVFDIGGAQQAEPLNSSGVATYVGNAPNPAGPITMTATYKGQTGSFLTSASNTLSPIVATTLLWGPEPLIVAGDPGSLIFNATADAPGTITYSATPSGGSPIPITTTSGLAPGSYMIEAAFNPSSNQYTTASANSSLTIVGETVWIVQSNGIFEQTPTGYILGKDQPGLSIAEALDQTGNIWTIGSSSPALEETSQMGVEQNSWAAGSGGLDLPAAIAIDGNSNIWIANGNNSISLIGNGGAAMSPSAGFTDHSLSTPSGVAVDLAGSVWIANRANNSLSRILGGGAPVAPLSTANKNNTIGAKP